MMNTLNLPMEYRKRPTHFDAFNKGEETESGNRVIESFLKKNQCKTVLDMTCGTGCQVFFLEKLGYTVTGADFSPALLEQARERARKEKIDVTFIDGDMRTLRVGTFDAVITIFNAIGHLTKKGFEKAIGTVHSNLKKGGIYIFDILNAEAMTDAVIADLGLCKQVSVGEERVYKIQCSVMDHATGRLISYDTCVVQNGANTPVRHTGQFSLQLYSAKQLDALLKKKGFVTVEHYGMDGAPFDEKTSRSILTIARKG